MAKHTPGPWHATPFRHPSGCADIGADDNSNVAEVFSEKDGGPPRPVAEANARLIAAAPTMAAYIEKQAEAGCPEAIKIMEAIRAPR